MGTLNLCEGQTTEFDLENLISWVHVYLLKSDLGVKHVPLPCNASQTVSFSPYHESIGNIIEHYASRSGMLQENKVIG